MQIALVAMNKKANEFIPMSNLTSGGEPVTACIHRPKRHSHF